MDAGDLLDHGADFAEGRRNSLCRKPRMHRGVYDPAETVPWRLMNGANKLH